MRPDNAASPASSLNLPSLRRWRSSPVPVPRSAGWVVQRSPVRFASVAAPRESVPIDDRVRVLAGTHPQPPPSTKRVLQGCTDGDASNHTLVPAPSCSDSRRAAVAHTPLGRHPRQVRPVGCGTAARRVSPDAMPLVSGTKRSVHERSRQTPVRGPGAGAVAPTAPDERRINPVSVSPHHSGCAVGAAVRESTVRVDLLARQPWESLTGAPRRCFT